MESPIALECSPTGQHRHLMTRPLTPTSASRLAGPAATQPGSAARLRSRAPNDAPAHADQRLPARRVSGDPAGQRRTPALSRALHYAHAHAHLRPPTRRPSGAPRRPAPPPSPLARPATRPPPPPRAPPPPPPPPPPAPPP